MIYNSDLFSLNLKFVNILIQTMNTLQSIIELIVKVYGKRLCNQFHGHKIKNCTPNLRSIIIAQVREESREES